MAPAPVPHEGYLRSATLAEWAVPGPSRGWTIWSAARQRNDRRTPPLDVPVLTKVRMPGGPRAVDSVPCNQAAAYVRFVVADAIAFFSDPNKVSALAEFSDEASVHAVRDELLGAEAERAAELQTTLATLPALLSSRGPAVVLPTKKHEGQILLGVFKCLEWLGESDPGHVWNNWLREGLTAAIEESSRIQLGQVGSVKIPVLVYECIAGSLGHDTPLVNVEALCILMRLLANHTPACKAATQEAYQCLMRVKVGDASLIPELQRNAATATAEARQFVLGPEEEEERQREWVHGLRVREHERLLREEDLRYERMEQHHRELCEDRKRHREENWRVGEEERAMKRAGIRLGSERVDAERKEFENDLWKRVEAGRLTEAQAREVLGAPRARIFKSLGQIIGLLDPVFDELRRHNYPFVRKALAELRAGFFGSKPQSDVCSEGCCDEILWYADDLPALWRFCVAQLESRRREARAPGKTTLSGGAPAAVPEMPPSDELRRRVLEAP